MCVPILRLAECILETKKDVQKAGLFAPIIGHVGDGHFHAGICAKKGDSEQKRLADDIYDRLIKRGIAMGGTCTGEHGIGRSKLKYLEMELGDGVNIMRRIKQALDPENLMNPGKIVSF